MICLLPCRLSAAGTPAGTRIDNQASVVFSSTDAPSRQTVYGNVLTLSIGQRAVVNLSPATGGRASGIGTSIDYPVVATNSGNGVDSLAISATSSLGLSVTIYRDLDRDGVLDADEFATAPLVQTPPLPADSSAPLIIRLIVPNDSSLSGRSDLLKVVSTSMLDPTQKASGSYTTEIRSASMAVSSGVSNPAPRPGARVTYTITYTNNGSGRAEELIITDVLNAGLHYVAGSAVPEAITIAGETATWSVTAVEPGERGTIQFIAEVDPALLPGTAIHNVVVARYRDGGILRSMTGTESSFITVTSGGGPLVTIGSDSTLAGESGDTIRYPLTITNTASATSDFQLRALSTTGIGWTFIDDLNGDGWPDQGEKTLSVIGQLGVGTTRKVIGLGRLPTVPADRTIDSTEFIVSVVASGLDLATCTGRIVISRPVMELIKSVSTSQTQSGSTITYSIAYSNTGGGRAEQFQIVDTIPPYTSLVAGSIRVNSVPGTEAADADGVALSGNVLMVDVGTVAPRSSGTIEFAVKIE